MNNSDNVKKKIDQAASFYKNFLNIDDKLLQYSFDTIKGYFRGSIALEIGPSNGAMTKLLVDKFKTLHVLEASDQLLKQIPNYKNVTKYNNLIEHFDSDVKYDTIIIGHVLEHIEDPILALKNIYSLLKNDGVFLVSVPNAKSLHRMVAVEMGMLESEYILNERDIELGHYRVYDMKILEEHLKKSGLNIVHMGGYFLKPISNGQIEKDWNEKMIEGYYKVGKHFQENCAEIYAVCSK